MSKHLTLVDRMFLYSTVSILQAPYNRYKFKQGAQLSQRDRATLCVIEYFTKSLKITQGHSK